MMNEPWQRLPALSLKQLQYFVTLAQLRHFTDTASRLTISQPALSSALRQIETVLGGKLVNRTAATVTLTELGAAILPHAQRILSVAQAAFSDMQQIVEAGGDGTVRIGLVPSVSSLLFPLLPQTLAEAFPRLRIEFHDQTNDALIQALQRGEIDFGIGAIDSSLPAELLVYPLAAQAHLPWKQLVGRDIAVFSKGNIQRLVAALVESHRLTLTTRYQVDYIETLYGLVRSRLAVAILPALYTTHLQDQALRVAHLQQPALARTVALMRGPQALPPLIEDCFSLLQAALR
ncbi:TPA: LysR family transcriptional regulator [Klebsiella pneumoniae]|nr:LysR family transcriptional regulator [Klebsiella pneumoniae]